MASEDDRRAQRAAEGAAAETDSRVRVRESAPSPEPDDLKPGTACGEYIVDALIGRGGMGSVYSARQPVIGKRVAVKLLAAEMTGDPTLVRRFIDEARAVNKIGHPNIIDIFSFGQLPDGRHYFVMELLEGETLRGRLLAGPVPPPELDRYVTQICSALEAAHREKIVHRDLKPENIWIAKPRHGESYVKLLDFGIAKLLEPTMAGESVTQTGAAMGTPNFMSPEQCRGQAVDGRTDIYALGVMLYEIYAGRLPFEGNTFLEILAKHLTQPPPRPATFRDVPPGIETLILACLEKDADKRPQHATEVLARFRHASTRPPSRDPERAALEMGATAMSTPAAGLPTEVMARSGGRKLLLVVSVVVLAIGIWFLLRSRAPVANTVKPKPPPTAATVPNEAPPVFVPSQPVQVPPSEPATPTAPSTEPVGAKAATAVPAVPPKAAPGQRPATEKQARDKPKNSRVENQGLVTENPFR